MKWFNKTSWLGAGLIGLGLLAACRQGTNPTASTGNFSTNQLKIEVAVDGMVQLSLADLQSTGLDVAALDAAHLHLSQANTAVPYLLTDDSLIFYGQAPTSRYTAVRPYILQTGKAGKVMMETSTATETTQPSVSIIQQQRHLEENHIYLSQAYQNEQSEVWYWQTLGQEEKIELNVELAAVADSPANLRLQLLGKTSNPEVEQDHDFDLIVNGQTVTTVRWDGETSHTGEAELAAGLLRTGPNQIVLDNAVPGASFLDIMELNWLELDYAAPATAVNDRLQFNQPETSPMTLDGFSGQPFLFDISQPAEPQLLTGWLYENSRVKLAVAAGEFAAVGPRGFVQPAAVSPLRQSDWHNTQNQADLIIITTDELAPALAPLIAVRQEQGLTVALVPLPEIYDGFGFGAAGPESIQQFVAYAVENWQEPSPRYLFLVGDATTDYRNYLGSAPRNHVPTLLVPVQYSGETVSDSRLADVDGDTKPDLGVGRWTVDSVRDVESLVERTLAYEGGTAVNQALFAADGTEPQFATMADRLRSESGLPVEHTTILNGALASDVTTAWNEGVWLTTYIGHGSVERWGKEDIFFPEAVADLNAATPPIVLQLTCLSGLFAHPDLQSLSETMLLDENGPVLLVGATSLTLSNNQEPFALSLLQALQDPTINRIGDAFQQAKESLAVGDNEGLREISDTFALIGDPSALVIRP
jgi:hypothetical protein